MRGLFKNLFLKLCNYNLRIGKGVRILNPKDIKFGKNVRIDDYVLLNGKNGLKINSNTQIRYATCIDTWKGNGIEIGKNVFIGLHCIIKGPGKIIIGDDCQIGSGVKIESVNHNFDDKTRPIRLQGTTTKGIVIENDVWLGSGVIVLDGVRIGEGSVVGAGAVVTKSIPKYSVAVGVPAKVIRKR